MPAILVPISDQAAGLWTTTPLWSDVDDDSTVSPTGDGTVITSDAVGSNTNTSNADLKLASGADQIATSGYVLRVRWNSSGNALQGHLELWQGIPGTGTMVAELLSAVDVGTTEVEDTLTLTSVQAGNITDYTDLYLRLWGRGTAGGPSRSLVVDLVELEVPAFAVGPFTVSSRTSQITTANTSHTVALPDGSNVSGRRVVVAFGAPTSAVTWPTGWTEFFDGSTQATRLSLAYRDIDGTEGFDGTDDTITVTTAESVQSNHHSRLISDGHDSGTAPEAATAVLGSGANADPPSFDPAGWATEETLWVAVAAYRFGASFSAAPANYIDLLSLGGGDSNTPLGSALRALEAASEDPGAFTSSDGANWVATTAAVRPAAAGGGPFAETVNDTAGVTDATALDQAKTLADDTGLTDQAVAALSIIRDAADDVTVTDTITVELVTETTDEVGLTDTISTQLFTALAETVADTVGLTDTVDAQLFRLIAETADDTVGVTDAVVVEQGPAFTDDVALTDAVTLDLSAAITDQMLLADTLVVELAVVLTDTAGLTDTAVGFDPENLARSIVNSQGTHSLTATSDGLFRLTATAAGVHDLIVETEGSL